MRKRSATADRKQQWFGNVGLALGSSVLLAMGLVLDIASGDPEAVTQVNDSAANQGITRSTLADAELDTDSLAELTYQEAKWHPIHFQPLIAKASNAQCLTCHRAILERRVLPESPAGLASDDALAWYQTRDTYSGPQDTFHRRHLVMPFAEQLMALRCNTCHQGHDPREEAPIPPTSDGLFDLRKMVSTEQTCLLCHGSFSYELMGLPGPWDEVRQIFGDNCMTCHIAIRTQRHQVNYLKPLAIEQAATEQSDVCYGCHGGRAWYGMSYPYPRHSWPGMSEVVPDWAEGRPTESARRFLPKP